MASSSGAKGGYGERDIARRLSDLLGVRIRRKLGAGRKDDEGDLEGLDDVTMEVKYFPKTGLGPAVRECLADLEREQANAGTTFAVGFCRTARSPWVVVMNLEQWATWYREATGESR